MAAPVPLGGVAVSETAENPTSLWYFSAAPEKGKDPTELHPLRTHAVQ